ncbi:MAG: hypothetical protein K0R57_1064 [Paenibacillaceae bacterium]|jgi:hypothetical protein|nr:hypothetical protein [Paenibacillaceae bacterium]
MSQYSIKNFWQDVILPIRALPKSLDESSLKWQQVPSFDFDKPERFYSCEIASGTGHWYRDDRGQLYYATRFALSDFNEMKLSRQIWRPSYMKADTPLPLSQRMGYDGNEYSLLIDQSHLSSASIFSENASIPLETDFDKAIAHINMLIEESPLDHLSLASQLAHCDGEDDPRVIGKLHLLRNRYNQWTTLFVAGTCSRSFCTLSNNDFYMNQIQKPHVSRLYLLYYCYFIRYGEVPSNQMMPQLLANLWRSTEANTHQYNPALFESHTILN